MRFQFPLLFILAFIVLTNPGNAVEPKKKDNSDKPTNLPKVKHMIDTHIHIYDTRRPEGVPWPRKNDKVLYKPHMPAEFKKVSKPSGLTGVVVVEASKYLVDNRWVLDLVKGDDYFVALVGRIDPYRDDFETQLVKLKKDKRFVGIRIHHNKPYDFKHPQLVKNFKLLQKHNLTLDFLANGKGVESIQEVNRIAKHVPKLRIVVNHVLGKKIDGKKPGADWVKEVQKLAKNPNVYCKVSGLYQRSIQQPAPTKVKHYQQVLDVVWKNFGHKRLIYGSNWPCTKRSGDYTSYVKLVNSFFSKKGQEACEHYYWKNANEAYKLGLK